MRLTIKEISQWIDNDEGLHNWCRCWCRQNKRKRPDFIRENRAELEKCIRNVLDGTKQAHYLAYGPDKRY